MVTATMQNQGLRVLLVDDSPEDARLLLLQLQHADYNPIMVRVETEAALRAALEQVWDVVISDNSMPAFNGMRALELVRATTTDLPFILLSGTIGQDRATAFMKAGADDFVSKDQQTTRLIAVIERELVEAKSRSAQRGARVAFDDVSQELAALVKGSPVGIFSDRNGRIVRWNPACERIFGVLAVSVIAHSLDWLPEQAMGEYRDLRDQVLKGGTFSSFETTWQRKDGRPVGISLSMAPLLDADSQVRGIIHLATDISERRHLEQQLLQAQKLEVVGRLAGGIAHDFNNLLTVINGRSQMMTEQMDPHDPLRQYAKLILQVGRRASRLTGQLLAFSRRQVFQGELIDLNGAVVEVEKILAALLGEDIEVVTRLEMGIPHITIDASQLEQILLNLAINARDAMPTGGTLAISTGQVTPEELRRRGVPCDVSCVTLRVADSGAGMEPAVLDRLFDLFFTTKLEGTGLGLATVQSIVKQSGGHIRVSSERSVGTTFTIYLPAVAGPPSRHEIADLYPAVTPGSGTILVVEDDAEVRSITMDILREHGYRVHAAGTWGEALEIVERHGAAIDLLLTDVIMPQVSGRELARRLTSICPRLQVLYMSGYSDQLLGSHGVLDPGIDLIQKPFEASGLLSAVRHSLRRCLPVP